MSSGLGGTNITSDLTQLIQVANAGGSSFVVSTDTKPALFVDNEAKVGINTLTPVAQLEVANEDGECIALRNGDSNTAVAKLDVTTNGDLEVNLLTTNAKVKTAALNVSEHNGSTKGLELNGELVRANANQLNYVITTPGTATASKALVLDSNKSVSGLTSVSASNLSGTVQTAAQPNITQVGTLSSLNVTNAVVANTLTGVVQTAAQPNITQIGTLSSLDVTNGVTATAFTGTVQTAAQPNITSIGNLASVTVAGSQIRNEAAFLSGAVAGSAANSKVMVLSSSGNISGINALSANQLDGTLQTGSQPNVTQVGTLSSLNVTNNITAAQLTGQLQTAAQPNITSVGNLTSLSVAGSSVSAEVGYLSGSEPGTAAASKVVVLNSSKSISGLGTVGASTLSGTLQTAAQPNITSIGNLSSLSVAGNSVSSEIGYLSGAVPGTGANMKVLVLNNSGSIGGITSISATNLSGVLQSGSQPNITSIGTLSSLTVGGSTRIQSTSDASGANAGGALTISGGASVAKKMYVGDNLYVAGRIFMNGVLVGTGGAGGSSPFLTDVVEGSASASKALIVDGNLNMSGINQLAVSQLTGSIRTASQPYITSVGTLTSLSVTNGIIADGVSATTFTGTLTPGPQTGITSVGALGSLAVTNGITTYSVSATTLTGTLTSGPQTGITSVGTLGSLTVTNGITATTLTGTLTSGPQTGITSVGTLGSLTVTGGITASTLMGTLASGPQTGITSVGTLGSLTVSGKITSTSTTDAASATDSNAAISISGGAAIAKNLYVGTDLYVTGTIYMNGTAISASGGGGGSSMASLTVTGTTTTGDLITSGTISEVGGVTWTGANAANGSAWSSICWSSYLQSFVAVASSGAGRVMTSPDGITWTTRTSTTIESNSWSSVCWASEIQIFVAVAKSGASNRVMMSSSGTAWVPIPSANETATWSSVCWSPDLCLFVAVAESGTVMTSINGSNWVIRSAPSSTWSSVCWSPELGMFVAVASSGSNHYMTSTNGVNWTAGTSQTGLYSVCWCPELYNFVTVGLGSLCVTKSQNGSSWTSLSSGSNSTTWQSICWAPELSLFIAVASAGTGNRLMTSPDGTSWTSRSSADNSSTWSSICWAPELSRLVAVASSGTTRVMISSQKTNSSLVLANNAIQTGIVNASKLKITPTCRMNYYSGLYGGHVFYNDTNIANVELMQITHKECKITNRNGTLTLSRFGYANTQQFISDTQCGLTIKSTGARAFTVAASPLKGTQLTVSGGTYISSQSGSPSGTAIGTYIEGPTFTSPNTLTIGTACSLYVSPPISANNTTFANAWAIYSTGRVSISDSTSTYALYVTGGVAVIGPLAMTGAFNSATATVTSSSPSTSKTTGALVVRGGAGFGGDIYANAITLGGTGKVVPVSAGVAPTGCQFAITPSTYTITASGTVTYFSAAVNSIGRPTIQSGSANVTLTHAATLYIENSPLAINTTSIVNGWALQIASGRVLLSDTTTSTSTTTGALIISGGVGIAGPVNMGNRLLIGDTTTSTSITTGALVVSGGVGIAGNINATGINCNGNSSYVSINNQTLGAHLITYVSTIGYVGLGYHESNNAVRLGMCDSSGSWASGNTKADLAVGILYHSGLVSDSDYRLKTDIEPLQYGIDQIMHLTPMKYKFKSDDKGRTSFGFIAHEAQEVIPELVTGNKDEVDENGEEVHQGILYVEMVPILVNAVQSLKTTNDQQAKELESLKQTVIQLQDLIQKLLSK